jgi:hypothetical protein
VQLKVQNWWDISINLLRGWEWPPRSAHATSCRGKRVMRVRARRWKGFSESIKGPERGDEGGFPR